METQTRLSRHYCPWTLTGKFIYIYIYIGPAGWCCRICRLRLCREVRHHHNECPEYDIKLADSEAPILEFYGM